MTRACTYIIAGFGYEVMLTTTQGPDAAIRRAMWSLISAGHIEIEGTPDEMAAQFTIESRVAGRGSVPGLSGAPWRHRKLRCRQSHCVRGRCRL